MLAAYQSKTSSPVRNTASGSIPKYVDLREDCFLAVSRNIAEAVLANCAKLSETNTTKKTIFAGYDSKGHKTIVSFIGSNKANLAFLSFM